VAVRDGKEDRLSQQGTEELDLLLMTRRAEPSAFTGEGQQILVFAVIAPDTRKASLQVATVQELVHHIRNDWAQEAVAGLVALLVHVHERVEMPRQALPEWRLPGPARTIDLLQHAAQCRKEGVSSNGIPLKNVSTR